jgi:dihydroorotate dehydrogenase electron transfer subunit
VSPGAPPATETGRRSNEGRRRTTAPFGRRLCPVLANEGLGPYRLVTADDPSGPAPKPGQFYMLAAAEGWSDGTGQRPYLARAFSVCRVRGSRLDFLVDDVGPGTRRLAALTRLDGLWLVGPLGLGFSDPEELGRGTEETRAILVGGGIGIAPLVIWEEALLARGVPTRTLLGFRSARFCESARLFGSDVAIATDDGSAGHEGRVSELLEVELERPGPAAVYACGPPAMLEAVRRACLGRGVPAELALEEAMACGYGACFGCVVRTTSGYRRLCVDGPVVAAADLDEHWLE